MEPRRASASGMAIPADDADNANPFVRGGSEHGTRRREALPHAPRKRGGYKGNRARSLARGVPPRLQRIRVIWPTFIVGWRTP